MFPGRTWNAMESTGWIIFVSFAPFALSVLLYAFWVYGWTNLAKKLGKKYCLPLVLFLLLIEIPSLFISIFPKFNVTSPYLVLMMMTLYAVVGLNFVAESFHQMVDNATKGELPTHTTLESEEPTEGLVLPDASEKLKLVEAFIATYLMVATIVALFLYIHFMFEPEGTSVSAGLAFLG